MEPVHDTFVSTALLAVKRQLLEISGAATSPQQPYRSGAKRFILTTRTLAASPSADQAAFPFQPQPLPAGSDEAACAATASEARMRAAARVSPNMDIGGILNGFDLGDDGDAFRGEDWRRQLASWAPRPARAGPNTNIGSERSNVRDRREAANRVREGRRSRRRDLRGFGDRRLRTASARSEDRSLVEIL